MCSQRQRLAHASLLPPRADPAVLGLSARASSALRMRLALARMACECYPYKHLRPVLSAPCSARSALPLRHPIHIAAFVDSSCSAFLKLSSSLGREERSINQQSSEALTSCCRRWSSFDLSLVLHMASEPLKLAAVCATLGTRNHWSRIYHDGCKAFSPHRQ